MPRPQFTLRALLVAMLVVGAFFGGIAVGRKHQESELQALRTATDEVIGKLLKSHTGAMDAAQQRIADLERDAEDRKTVQRMPTLRRRTDRMPTLRDPLDEAEQ